MWCYVGKATKIFIAVVAVMAVVGLVLGLGVFRHGIQRAPPPRKCEGGDCRGPTVPLPTYADPMPAAAAAAAAAATAPPPSSASTAPPSFLTPPAPPAVPQIPAAPPTSSSAAAPPPALSPPTISAAGSGSAAPPPASGHGVAAAQGPGPFLAHDSHNT